MLVEFDEKDHAYAINGDIANISVTELLRKHGLAPNYAGVSKEKLARASARGKAVHKDLENILNTANYTPTTRQGEQFAEWVRINLDSGVGEQMLGYSKDGLTIAGTADVIGIAKDGALIIGDHKNTAKFHAEYVSWQVSLYDYFLRQLNGEALNGHYLNWKGATRFYCFHYNTSKNGRLEVHRLDKVTDAEIERLLECEKAGKIYQRQTLVVEQTLQDKVVQAEKYLAQVEQMLKDAKAQSNRIRAQMLSVFEKQGVSSWTSPNGDIKVSYQPSYDRISVDSTKLKREYPQTWEKCQKVTKVRSTLKVRVKGAKDGGESENEEI